VAECRQPCPGPPFSAGLQGCAETAGIPPLFLTLDHEGEYINRFDEVATMFPAALALGATGDPELAGQVARAAGQELAYSGVNMVLGPVADVLLDYDNGVVSQRTFGGDPAQVSLFVAESVLGYKEAGLVSALKHFPGHGGVAGDRTISCRWMMLTSQRWKAPTCRPFAAGWRLGPGNHVRPRGLPAGLWLGAARHAFC
jgi:beta-N-acetylhexosaminidase